ncbi:MAG: SGNH/GDSL hydrolase family protein [Verrucomicrobiota bacterium]|nr:SGNH/GDSL hydrolase family protein [Verrucomicrobiota bacterium]
METISRPRQPRSAGRLVLFRVLAVSLSIMVCWVVLELILRIFPVDQPRSLAEHPMLDRGRNFFYPDEERVHPYTDEHDDMLRLALVGDSFTAGAGCDAEDTYGMRLERMLNYNADQRPARIDIFAKGGTAPPTQIAMLERALSLKPDLVCLGICLNDAEDWMHKERLKQLREGMMPRLPADWFRPILHHSRVIHLGYQKWSAQRVQRGYRKYFRDIWEEDAIGARAFFQAVSKMRALCAKADVPFCAIVFPMFSYDLSREGYAFLEIHSHIRVRLEEMSIPCLDLFPAFEGRSPERMQAFPGYDGHPSEIAHRLASQELLFFLIDRGLIEEGYLPKQASGSILEYYGPLYRRVATPADF